MSSKKPAVEVEVEVEVELTGAERLALLVAEAVRKLPLLGTEEAEDVSAEERTAYLLDSMTRITRGGVDKDSYVGNMVTLLIPYTDLYAPYLKGKEKDGTPKRNPESTCPSEVAWEAQKAAINLGLPPQALYMLSLDADSTELFPSASDKDVGKTPQAKLELTTANRRYWQAQGNGGSRMKDIRNRMKAMQEAAEGGTPARKGTDRARLIKAAEQGVKITKQILAKDDFGGQVQDDVATLLVAWETIKKNCEALEDIPNESPDEGDS